MIVFLLPEGKIKKELEKKLQKLSLALHFMDIRESNSLKEIYQEDHDIRALVTMDAHPLLPTDAWLDLLDALGRRFPVIVVSKEIKHASISHSYKSGLVSWMQNPKGDDILASLKACGALASVEDFVARDAVPIYNPMHSLHMLQHNGSLSILSIHTAAFRNIATEYGSEAFHMLQLCFQQLIFQLWGASGSFRRRDILCRNNSPHGTTFYILLDQSRSEATIPPPGALEKLADRLITKLQGQMWGELFKPAAERRLPVYLREIPKFSVGYATVLYNPCVDSSELIESLFETSLNTAKLQHLRIFDRQREFMQALIQTPDMLTPHYQGIFNAKTITVKALQESLKENSLAPLANYIYGFESLIRINKENIHKILNQEGPINFEPRYLQPEILFAMASSVKLSLELDQACLRQATHHFEDLPGRLMVNILPRNFYYIDQLQHLIRKGTEVTFEVSESEAINNFGLLQQARETLYHKNFAIAIDDFGKGYAGLDRIIKIKPEIIKLDRSLIQDIHKDLPKKAFVSGLVNAAHITNSIILAEGVELLEEMQVLIEIGVDLLQGFLFHHPQSIHDIKAELGVNASSNYETVA